MSIQLHIHRITNWGQGALGNSQDHGGPMLWPPCVHRPLKFQTGNVQNSTNVNNLKARIWWGHNGRKRLLMLQSFSVNCHAIPWIIFPFWRLTLSFAILETIPWRQECWFSVECVEYWFWMVPSMDFTSLFWNGRPPCVPSWRLVAKRRMNVWCWW